MPQHEHSVTVVVKPSGMPVAAAAPAVHGHCDVIVYVAPHMPVVPLGQGAANTVSVSSISVGLPSAPVKVTWRMVLVASGLTGPFVIVGFPPERVVVGRVMVVVSAEGQVE